MGFDKLKVMNKMGEAAHKKSRAAEPKAEGEELPVAKKKPAAKKSPFPPKK